MASLELNSSITIPSSVYFTLRDHAYQTIVLTALQVIYLTVFAFALRSFLKNGVRTAARKTMFLLLVTMAASTTTSYVLFVLTLRDSFLAWDTLSSIDQRDAWGFLFLRDARAELALLALNIIIGDVIISWRAIVIWRNSKIILAISIIATLISFGAWIMEAVFLPSSLLFLVAIPSTLAVSIWATSVIGFRFWKYRKARKDLPALVLWRRTSAENILAILIESGVLYVATWTVYTVLIALGPSVWAIVIMTVLIPLQPTIVILLVALHKMPLTDILTGNDSDRVNTAASIVFARPSDDSSTNTGIIREIMIVGCHSLESITEGQVRGKCQCSDCSRKKPESRYVLEIA